MTLWVALARFVMACVAAGVFTLLLGMLIPRKLNYRAFPYKPYKFEADGRLYRKLGVHVWKKRMPDASRVIKRMTKKALADDLSPEFMERLTQETCIAESTHWVLILLCPLFALAAPGYGACFAIVYALCNVPFIMIQRYNRPRMIRAMEMRLARESR